MRVLRTITATEMRGINRTAVLDLIRREGAISRTDIAERLNLSVPTVMRIIDELVGEKLVRETGSKEWSGGRRRSLVEFNAAAHLVVGVDMGGTKVFGALSDLSGKLYNEIKISQHGTQGEDSYQLLKQMTGELLQAARQTGKNLLGIGVGVPGTVALEDGLVYHATALDWHDFPLKQRLEADFGVPAVVDNDVNLSALGELWFGGHPGVNNLVLITVGTGIGAGVILDGALYRGSHQAAGEVGFLLPSAEALRQRYIGFGALELLASGTGIAQRGRLARLAQRALAGQMDPAALEALSAEEVFEAARQGEAWAVKVIEDTVDLLAMAVSAVGLCYDPDVVILGGGVARSADLLVEPIRRRLEQRMPVVPQVVASALGYRAAVMGTIVNLVYHTSDFFVVRKLA